MNVGKEFEKDFSRGIPDDCFKLRLNDPAQSFANPDSLRFSPKNPFDYLLFRAPVLLALELKSTQGAISFWREDSQNKTASIKKCQIEGLNNAAKYKDVVAGLVLNFRQSEATYFLPIADFLSFRDSTQKKSINEKDIIALGAFPIPQTKKRTKYAFDVEALLNYAERRCASG